MTISIIVAISDNNVIGINNTLPWHLPVDLKFFKEKTAGHCILMGRKTFESLKKPLPNRTNIVLTTKDDYHPEGCIIVRTIEEGIARAKEINENELFIIGGAQLFKDTVSIADHIYITRVHTTITNGDVFFPEWDNTKFDLADSNYFKADEKNKFDLHFELYRRKT